MHIRVGNGSTVSVIPQGADKLADLTSTVIANLQVVGASYVALRSYGSGNGWEVLSGDQALRSSSLFGTALTASGYQKLPSGLILQWGSATLSAANTWQQVTLPLAFPTGSAFVVYATPAAGGARCGASGVSTTTVQVISDVAGSTVYWLAIGR
ncbi:gp53-like domain-containing protein [Pseudomonas denitrificans (nom. rej.)]|uniref:gp53-like domain-containing protein n=1 Tax=Pseudomonas denitrificans TaxID=43306 RepID=UPI003F4A9586